MRVTPSMTQYVARTRCWAEPVVLNNVGDAPSTIWSILTSRVRARTTNIHACGVQHSLRFTRGYIHDVVFSGHKIDEEDPEDVASFVDTSALIVENTSMDCLTCLDKDEWRHTCLNGAVPRLGKRWHFLSITATRVQRTHSRR